jgi:signal transduction histidine kinase
MTAVAGSRLPGLLGHELRNPLASAMTGAMLARDMVDADDPRAAVLDGVLRDLDRMTALIDGWLAMARGVGSGTGMTRLRVDDLLAQP